MGCDIHVMCEVKNNGKWEINTEEVFPDSHLLWCKEHNKKAYDGYIESGRKTFTNTPDNGRYYDWFGILADVRNGRGFAGVKTGEGFIPISEPKGVPKDATQEWKECVESWDSDMHSKSYLTVDEFLNYDWNRTTQKAGCITIKEYESLKGTNKCPESWCGAVSGPNIVTVTMDEANELLNGNTIKYESKDWLGEVVDTIKLSMNSGKDIYVFYVWEVDYKEWFQSKFDQWVVPMQKLKEKYEDVRVVFGFDN